MNKYLKRVLFILGSLVYYAGSLYGFSMLFININLSASWVIPLTMLAQVIIVGPTVIVGLSALFGLLDDWSYYKDEKEEELVVLPEPEVETAKTMVLSTGNLPFDEFQRLDEQRIMGDTLYRVIKHSYGIMVVVSPTDDFEEFEAYRKEYPYLSKITSYALNNDYRYVDFDQDGAESELFKGFSW